MRTERPILIKQIVAYKASDGSIHEDRTKAKEREIELIKLERKRQLLIKESEDGLDLDEKEEMISLTKDLSNIDFSYRDPLYKKFVLAKCKLSDAAIDEDDISILKKILEYEIQK